MYKEFEKNAGMGKVTGVFNTFSSNDFGYEVESEADRLMLVDELNINSKWDKFNEPVKGCLRKSIDILKDLADLLEFDPCKVFKNKLEKFTVSKLLSTEKT